MIKLENIKVGVVVCRPNCKAATFTITDINSKIMINGTTYNSICYTPNYTSSYTRFARDIDSFMSTFEIVS